jgi:GT2 family glycosyltransferase
MGTGDAKSDLPATTSLEAVMGPVLVAQWDVADERAPRPVGPDTPRHWARARVLIRDHARVLGFADVGLSTGEVTLAELRRAASVLQRRRPEDDGAGMPYDRDGRLELGPDRPDDSAFLTVAICTRDRPGALERCLASVQRLNYSNFEVLVVDNAPRTDASHDVVEKVAASDGRVRYLLEPRAGLSRARNLALAEARSDVVAFADDDVVVDEWWLDALAAALAVGRDVACITGLVASARLVTPSEQYFDSRVRFADRVAPVVYRGSRPPAGHGMFPYQPGLFGVGANFAVDRRHVLEIGGFDNRLGAGSRTAGGEDLDLFVRIIRSGMALVYQPTAVVWRYNLEDPAALQAQMRAYGQGLGAVVAKWAGQRETRGEMLRRVVPALAHLSRLWVENARRESRTLQPRRLVLAEAIGAVQGPFSFVRSRHDDDGVERHSSAVGG